MKVMMYGLYGGMTDMECYYRNLGGCFEFVNDIEYATNLTVDEANRVIENSDWYCAGYRAEGMKIVE